MIVIWPEETPQIDNITIQSLLGDQIGTLTHANKYRERKNNLEALKYIPHSQRVWQNNLEDMK